jgi:mono/diheme cytochrome c family protein
MPDFALAEAEALALTLFLTQPGSGGAVDPRTNAATRLDARQSVRRDAGFAEVASRFPGVSAEHGRSLFGALNCVACHAHDQFSRARNGPDLTIEGSRVNRAWLKAYLLRPHPLRPFGYFPGSGARMPDFRLSAEEAALIGDYLMSRTRGLDPPEQAFQPKPLSAFARRKAHRLLENKLSCLGCHSLGGEGGRIGPALDGVGERLQPSYIHRIINRPESLDTDIMMPGARLPERTLNLVVNYLLEQIAPPTSVYPSLIQHSPSGVSQAEGGALLYEKYCAQCHGIKGDGDGFNASYLPDPPTRHSDAGHMSTRPDDTLYDGIAVGGYVLDKSHLMPAWGARLSSSELRGLVAHMRQLCRCEAPDWSLR